MDWRILRPRFFLAGVAVASAVVAGGWWLLSIDQRTIGRRDALSDIQNGELGFARRPRSGISFDPLPGAGDGGQVLRKYSIGQRQAHDPDYVLGYNEVMLAEIERRHGGRFLERVAEEAARDAQLEEDASGRPTPPQAQ